MNARERFHETMGFGRPDRVPYWEMGYWQQTLHRWHEEGLPEDVHLSQYFGFDRREMVPLSEGMIPYFEPETLEETERYIITRGGDGVVAKQLKEGERHGMRMSMDQRLEYPVRDRATFREFKKRFKAKSPCRYPAYWEDYKRTVKGRDYPLGIHGGSLFGWPRGWMGLEGIATTFYDDPGLVHEMMEFIADFVIELIEPALREIGDIDQGVFWEDMCYKTASMISPKHFKEFMVPPYQRITGVMRKYGIKYILVDTDGNHDELNRLFLEGGVNGIYPLECAAGEDPVRLRKEYGKELLLW